MLQYAAATYGGGAGKRTDRQQRNTELRQVSDILSIKFDPEQRKLWCFPRRTRGKERMQREEEEETKEEETKEEEEEAEEEEEGETSTQNLSKRICEPTACLTYCIGGQ